MRTPILMRTAAVTGAAALVLGLSAVPASSADTTTVGFDCTGSAQSWVVPAGVTEITVELWGAQGGQGVGSTASDSLGGLGGHVQATIPVTPGETLDVNVGCEGGASATGTAGGGGFPDGGDGGTPFESDDWGGAGGGGSSDVRQGGTALGDRVLVAGGGGGGGVRTGSGPGGNGGGAAGTAGANNANDSISGGGGANGTTGGTAGSGAASAGALGQGGDGADNTGNATGWAGAAGGGGLAGGGGGGADTNGNGTGAGGGGSGLCDTGCIVNEAGIRSGDGRIEITYTVPSGGGGGGTEAPVAVPTDPTFTG